MPPKIDTQLIFEIVKIQLLSSLGSKRSRTKPDTERKNRRTRGVWGGGGGSGGLVTFERLGKMWKSVGSRKRLLHRRATLKMKRDDCNNKIKDSSRKKPEKLQG